MMIRATRAAHAGADPSGEPPVLEVYQLMTSAEVGELLRVSQATLSRWREQGSGPRAIWLSPRVPRYVWADLRDWIERNRA